MCSGRVHLPLLHGDSIQVVTLQAVAVVIVVVSVEIEATVVIGKDVDHLAAGAPPLLDEAVAVTILPGRMIVVTVTTIAGTGTVHEALTIGA